MAAKRKFTGLNVVTMSKCQDYANRERCQRGDAIGDLKCIILDCEGFYYLFEKLEAFITYPKLEGDLEKHHRDMIEYEKNHESIPDLMPQFVVNGTLAAELALKAIIFKEKQEFEYGHNLRKLFYQLPEPHKSILTEKICQEVHQNEKTLLNNLNNIANLFEDFRYCFEHSVIGYSNFLNNFIHIVCDYAISLKPTDDKNNRYALSRSTSPTLVSNYTEHLPDKKLLEEKLRELTDLALEMGEVEETD